MSEPEPEKSQPTDENIRLICSNCDARLFDRGCKMLCPRCGYFMGCSGFV